MKIIVLLILIYSAGYLFGKNASDESMNQYLNSRLFGKVEGQMDTFQDYMVAFSAGPFPADEDKLAYEGDRFQILDFSEFKNLQKDSNTEEKLYLKIVNIENAFRRRKLFNQPKLDASLDLVPSPIPYALIYIIRKKYEKKSNPRVYMLRDLNDLVGKHGYTLTAFFWESAGTEEQGALAVKILKSKLPKTKALRWYLHEQFNLKSSDIAQ